MMNKGGGSYNAKFTGISNPRKITVYEQLRRKRHGPG